MGGQGWWCWLLTAAVRVSLPRGWPRGRDVWPKRRGVLDVAAWPDGEGGGGTCMDAALRSSAFGYPDYGSACVAAAWSDGGSPLTRSAPRPLSLRTPRGLTSRLHTKANIYT